MYNHNYMKIEKYLKLLKSVLFKKLKYSYRNRLNTVIETQEEVWKGSRNIILPGCIIYNTFSDFSAEFF